MKKTTYLVVIAALLAIPGASWALPKVTLEGTSCDVVFNVPAGFDAQASALMGILAVLGVEGLPADWHDADLESDMTGDGLPDFMQLGLLGAVVCAGDPLVVGQFEANKATYLGLVSGVQGIFTNATALAITMDTTGDDIMTWLDTPQPGMGGATPRMVLPPATVTQIEAIAGGLIAAAVEIGGFIAEYGTYIPLLQGFAPIFAGLGGLSTEMYTSFEHIINVDLLGSLGETAALLIQLRDYCLFLAGSVPIPPMTAPLAAELTATAGAINAVATAMSGISLPPFEIYGVAKTSSEPFSSAMDYNGNGDTNAQVYQSLLTAGVVTLGPAYGGRPEFVAAASGADPFYPGATGLPVAGLLGLSLLAGACGVVGAFSIRKK